jgi:class 3 adenylate cyclase/tetratricopeptide (TPR) repeat protein
MKCPHCGHENRVQAKFCEQCAARLVRTCIQCGSELSATGKFCSECGHAVPAGSQPDRTPPEAFTPKHAHDRIVLSNSVLEGEHRQITVLFADICGFTRLSTELGSEATHTLLNHYFAVVDKIIEDYGGTVDKHIGDNVMAVFGAPVAHTDDPQRAIRTAREIHRAIEAVSKTAARRLQVHIGIATGQVVASKTGSDTHREYTVTGPAVNLASRLQDMAGPAETYISDAVQRAVARLAISEAQGEVEIDGLEQPVRVWKLHDLVAEPPPAGSRPFVGRRSELAQFSGILAACRETGHGQTVFVRGEAGIGKTRLVDEFQRLAEQQGFACHMSLVLDFGVGRGQDAIRTLVRSLLRIPPKSDQDIRAAAADRAFAEGLLTHDRRVYLNDLLDLPQSPDLRIVYEAMDNSTRNTGKQESVVELVSHRSAAQPLLIVVEDIHWADPATLAYLATLSRTVMISPAVLIMTSRSEGDPINQTWRGAAGGSPLMTIDMAPLRESEALELAKEYLETSNRFALTCIERAEGNPLFLEQLLRSAEEAGEENVPGSVQSLVQWRMDRLPPSERTALQAASVLGQRFTLSALQHLIERPQYNCSALVEHFLIRPVAEGFLFAHALVREGVYLSLLRTRQKELHRRAAEWFADHDSVLRAQHLDRAEDPEAAQAYLEVARAQVGQYDFARARQLAERGLEIADDPATRYALTCLQGDILRELGDSEESIKAFERALETAADDAQRSKAWIGLAESMRIVDRYHEAFAALDNAEAPQRERDALID